MQYRSTPGGAPESAATAHEQDPFHHELTTTLGMLLRSARAQLRNPDWAADAVSETVIAALERRPAFTEPGRLRAWMFGVLRYKMVDQLRLHLRESGADEHHEADLLFAPDHVASGDPMRQACGTQFKAALAALLERMPPRQARAVILCDALGYSTKEACAELAMTPGALWVMLHRARTRLREEMRAHLD
jgi:RNA polymerase sigma-70 factor (ECF subfamily)